MSNRDEVYSRFGPLLLEAVILVIMEQVNLLREEQGMPEMSEQDLIDSLINHLSELTPYDWMTGEP